MKPRNEKLGTWTCDAGGVADVFQTKKLGKHFYTHCDCCGLNQGTGTARQQKIFDEAEFINKATVVVPSNVNVGKIGVVSTVPPELEKPADKNSGAPAKDFDPSEPVPQSVGQQEESKPFPTGKFIAGIAFMLAAGAGIWLN